MTPAIEREMFHLPRAPAADTEFFAIGDIHGRDDLLDALLEAAAREPLRAGRRELAFLGDLVDRGPHNLATIRLSLSAGWRIGAGQVHRLMGNHEIMMRLALDPATPLYEAIDALAIWARNGGRSVLSEIAPDLEGDLDALTVLRRVRAATPAFVRDWLDGLTAYVRSGGLLFVHAGVNPDIALEPFLATPWYAPLAELVERRHWAWVRAPFLGARPGPEGFSGYLVVHGHSPLDLGHFAGHQQQIAHFRLNLDAGSVLTGKAKLAIFRDAEVEVITAHGQPGRRA